MGESVLSAGFVRVDGSLACDGVSLETIARAAGTPAYVYSAEFVRHQYASLARVLAPVPHRIHYSVKANSSLAMLALLQSLGAGVDIVSGGELFRALRAGFAGHDIVFSGVGKTERELAEAIDAGVLLVNVESEGELQVLERVAAGKGVIVSIALRINPEVTVETPHRYTRTGERGLKFGVPYARALDIACLAESLPHIRLAGLDMHIGSQVSSLDPYRDGMRKLLDLLGRLRALPGGARDIRYLDIGGGLAVTYEDERATDLDAFAAAVLPQVAEAGLSLIVEPGRFIVGNAGVLLTRVLYRKRSGDHQYIITDAGMNDLLRPSHYNAYHGIEAVGPTAGHVVADVVGPVCESGDFFALGRDVDDVNPGELLVVHSAGAYGFSMASNYNSRPRAAEVLVDGGRFAIITERERYEDLVNRERSLPQWRDS
jgi:diaminopimelate decarboxylase